MKIYNLYERTVPILREHSETRDNDGLLIAMIDEKLNPVVKHMPYSEVMSNRPAFGLPSCESIRRVRQKAQENHPELASSKKTQEARDERRIEMEEFARTVKA